MKNTVTYNTARGLPPILHWGGPVLSFLLMTPLGWMLLPVTLFLIVITVALSVTVLPTLLAAVAARVILGTARLPRPHRLWLAPLVLIGGIGLNALLWHTVHQAFLAG